MNITKNVARKLMTAALMLVAPLAVSVSLNVSHANAATNAQPQVTATVHQHSNSARAARNAQPRQGAQFNRMLHIAKSKLGHKYVYGAVGPKHFDCSGFTKYIYKKGIHKTLPRTAQAQYNSAKHVSKHNRQQGDLVFFGGSRHSISHVGMYIGHGKMIDSQNRGVVIENVKAPWWHAVGYARPAKLF